MVTTVGYCHRCDWNRAPEPRLRRNRRRIFRRNSVTLPVGAVRRGRLRPGDAVRQRLVPRGGPRAGAGTLYWHVRTGKWTFVRICDRGRRGSQLATRDWRYERRCAVRRSIGAGTDPGQPRTNDIVRDLRPVSPPERRVPVRGQHLLVAQLGAVRRPKLAVGFSRCDAGLWPPSIPRSFPDWSSVRWSS